MAVRYQLVLQFPFSGMEDYDYVIAYESLLMSRLPRRLARVDGHDVGSGEMNIFIITDRPEKALEECRSLIRSSRISDGLNAAYRTVTGDEYVRLWPKGSTEPFAVA